MKILEGVELMKATAKNVSRIHPRDNVHVYRWEDVPDDATIRLDSAHLASIDGRPVRLVQSYRDEEILPFPTSAGPVPVGEVA